MLRWDIVFTGERWPEASSGWMEAGFREAWEFLNLLVSQKEGGREGRRVPRQNERGVAPGVRFSFSTKLSYSAAFILREFFFVRRDWRDFSLRSFGIIGRRERRGHYPLFFPPPFFILSLLLAMFIFTRNSRWRENVCTTDDNRALRQDLEEEFFFSFRWKSFTREKEREREIIEIDFSNKLSN